VIRNVAVPVVDGTSVFELGVICEVFGMLRDDPELPRFDFDVCALQPGAVSTQSRFSLLVDHDFGRLQEADLIAVPAMESRDVPEALLDGLRRAVDRGARVLSVCSGAFVLGAAGLLDDRDCTTHWRYADELARRFPRARVNPDVLYVDDRGVITSAGTSAGIDACIYLIREEFGTAVANRLARRMVIPPHREGGQRQYVDMPVPACDADTLSETLQWMLGHLDEELSVEQLAARAHLSARTFARRFRAETGTTPHHWLTEQRVSRARQLLEETDQAIESVAAHAGFGSAAVLRHHFIRRVGTTPQAYRRAFARAGVAS
jgi:transcriptional regulator GlxA family with amidase domain